MKSKKPKIYYALYDRNKPELNWYGGPILFKKKIYASEQRCRNQVVRKVKIVQVK